MRYLRLLWYALLDRQIDWKSIPEDVFDDRRKLRNKELPYLVSYNFSFPKEGWGFTLTKVDNTTMYDTTLIHLTEVVWKHRLETYRELLKVYNLNGTIILKDGTILDKNSMKEFLLEFFM